MDTHPVRTIVRTTLDLMRQWDFQLAETASHLERATEHLTLVVGTRDARTIVACLKDVRRCSRNVLLHKRGAHWQGSQAMHSLELAVVRVTSAVPQAA